MESDGECDEQQTGDREVGVHDGAARTDTELAHELCDVAVAGIPRRGDDHEAPEQDRDEHAGHGLERERGATRTQCTRGRGRLGKTRQIGWRTRLPRGATKHVGHGQEILRADIRRGTGRLDARDCCADARLVPCALTR